MNALLGKPKLPDHCVDPNDPKLAKLAFLFFLSA